MSKKIIVIDIGSDRMGNAMNTMLDDGAFPPRLGQIIKSMMGDIYPMEAPCNREMWPGVGFPVGDPMHVILNYLYGTAQRPSIPEDVMHNMRNEVSNVMECSGGFDEDMKKGILRGSTKIYNRVLSDGTEIKVEIKKPVAESKGLDGVVEDMEKRKTAARKSALKNMSIDADKLIRFTYRAGIGNSAMKDIAVSVFRKASEAGIKLLVSAHGAFLSDTIRKIAEETGIKEDTVIEETKSDSGTENKCMVAGHVFDRRKFTQYPFDSVENARKACGKQVTDIICDQLTGNIKEDSLQNLGEYSEDDPLMGRLLDKIASLLKWQENA